MFWVSKEPSHWDGSFEYPQHMFWLRNKKKYFSITHSKLKSCVSHCLLGNIACFLSSAGCFQNHLFWKIISEIPSWSNSWDPDQTDIFSGLIWDQTVCKSYQQTTLLGNELLWPAHEIMVHCIYHFCMKPVYISLTRKFGFDSFIARGNFTLLLITSANSLNLL